MVAIRVEERLPRAAIGFLQHCYKFTNEQWQHLDRLDLPDQGYEQHFRSSCVTQLFGWEISQEREMRLGQELTTASGILHEIDIVARHPEVNAIMELKNRHESPDKNDIVVFFAKILDYMAGNSELLLKETCPVFMSTASFDVNGLAACFGLGIHPVCPGLRPFPLLVDNGLRIEYELKQGVQVPDAVHERFEDYCAELNSLSLSLNDTWFSSRFGYLSEDAILMKVAPSLESQAIGHTIRQLNSDCNVLLSSVWEAKQ